MLDIVFGVLLGVVIGVFVTLLLTPRKSGNLVIDTTNEDGPYFFLELEEKPDRLVKKKLTILKVVHKGYFEG